MDQAKRSKSQLGMDWSHWAGAHTGSVGKRLHMESGFGCNGHFLPEFVSVCP